MAKAAERIILRSHNEGRAFVRVPGSGSDLKDFVQICRKAGVNQEIRPNGKISIKALAPAINWLNQGKVSS